LSISLRWPRCSNYWSSVSWWAARGRYGVKAPAVTGPMFERAYRVQMNTLELMVLFIPALYLAARYWPPAWAAAVGAVYGVGRLLYRAACLRDPASRGLL
jgi:hypothetical protein